MDPSEAKCYSFTTFCRFIRGDTFTLTRFVFEWQIYVRPVWLKMMNVKLNEIETRAVYFVHVRAQNERWFSIV